MPKTYFFRDRPIFGITISHSDVQVMQVTHKDDKLVIRGYGAGVLDDNTVKDGIITNPESVARSIRLLLDNALQGKVTTDRLAFSIPSARTFSRAVTMPNLPPEQLAEAVMLETEQYTPVAIDNLYVDYTPINKIDDQTEIFTVAASKQVIDSYLEVAKQLQLEPVLIETRADSVQRLFAKTKFGGIPSVLIDFDKDMVDISIVDKHIVATATVTTGPDFNNQITKALASKPALPKLQPVVDEQTEASKGDNQLQQFIKEIRRMVRYYEERYDRTRQIEQIVLVGDEARIPSLAALMTDQLRLAVRTVDLWQLFDYEHDLSPLPVNASAPYIAVAGLASVDQAEVFA